MVQRSENVGGIGPWVSIFAIARTEVDRGPGRENVPKKAGTVQTNRERLSADKVSHFYRARVTSTGVHSLENQWPPQSRDLEADRSSHRAEKMRVSVRRPSPYALTAGTVSSLRR
jgi:hypothetical protein